MHGKAEPGDRQLRGQSEQEEQCAGLKYGHKNVPSRYPAYLGHIRNAQIALEGVQNLEAQGLLEIAEPAGRPATQNYDPGKELERAQKIAGTRKLSLFARLFQPL